MERYTCRDARDLFLMQTLDDALTGETQTSTSYQSLRLSGQTASSLASALGVTALPGIPMPFAKEDVSPHLLHLTRSAVGAFIAPHSRLERDQRLLRLLHVVFGSRLSVPDGGRRGAYRVAPHHNPEGGSKISRADVADFILKQLGRDKHLRGTPALAY